MSFRAESLGDKVIIYTVSTVPPQRGVTGVAINSLVCVKMLNMLKHFVDAIMQIFIHDHNT